MDVDMWHRLTACLANIDTNIVSIRLVVPVDDDFHFINQRPDSRFFLGRRLKIFSHMPARDNQAMAGVNRVAVIVGKSQFVFDNPLRLATKDTILVLRHVYAFLAREADEPAARFKMPLNRMTFPEFFHPEKSRTHLYGCFFN
jgi:hypothetical protein